MSEWVDLKAVATRLADLALLDPDEAGTRLQEALLKGELRTRTPALTSRPITSAAIHDENSLLKDEASLEPAMWRQVAVDWESHHPFYRFFENERVHLTSLVEANRSDALDFLRRLNVVSGTPTETEVLPEPKEKPRGKGGRPWKYDWAAAAGFLAGHVVENDWQPAADLAKELQDWFDRNDQGGVDKREVERFVEEMLRQRPAG